MKTEKIELEEWESKRLDYTPEELKQIDILTREIADLGGKFTWAEPFTKGPFRKGWNKDPIELKDLDTSKNIGVLMNHSPGIFIFDLDKQADYWLEERLELKGLPTVYREDAQHKLKVVFENQTTQTPGRFDIVASDKPRHEKEGEVFIGGGDKGFQALIYGDHEDGQLYKIRNAGPLPVMTDELFEEYWNVFTGESPKLEESRKGETGTGLIYFSSDSLEILEGSRDDQLLRFGGRLRGRGRSKDQIQASLFGLNKHCNPPLPKKQVEKIYQQVLKFPPGEETKPRSDEYILLLAILGYQFRMSELDDRLLVNGEPISDPQVAEIKSRLRDSGYESVNVAMDASTAWGYRNSFHPIKNYLDGLAWDHFDHIGILSEYFKDERDIFKTWFYRWAVGAVERVYRPGYQNRVLVLDGPQDLGKSTFVKWLASSVPDHYKSGGINPDNKDNKLDRINNWIWEISEFGATTRRSDIEAFKDFISSERTKERNPYGHYPIDKPNLVSFIATVNNTNGFLNDPTGSRRFMSTTLTDINWNYYREVNPNQVWAQARALYDGGETGRLSKEERELANEINTEYEIENPIAVHLDKALTLDPGGWVTTESLVSYLSPKVKMGDRTLQMEVSNYMKTLRSRGVEQKRRSKDGRRQKGYQGVTLDDIL